MAANDLFPFLIKVVTSWQIIAVTVALLIYISLVSYVARVHHHSHSGSSNPKPKKQPAPKPAAEETPEGNDDEVVLVNEPRKKKR